MAGKLSVYRYDPRGQAAGSGPSDPFGTVSWEHLKDEEILTKILPAAVVD